MRELAYNFSAHYRDGRRARATYCTNDCLVRHATLSITETQTAYDPQREILRAIPACENNLRGTIKTPLGQIFSSHCYL
jgi:hypothetical protein